MLIPLMFPSPFVPLPHSSGPPAMPRPPEPGCAECVRLGNALTWAQRTDDSTRTQAVLDELSTHFNTAHAT